MLLITVKNIFLKKSNSQSCYENIFLYPIIKERLYSDRYDTTNSKCTYHCKTRRLLARNHESVSSPFLVQQSMLRSQGGYKIIIVSLQQYSHHHFHVKTLSQTSAGRFSFRNTQPSCHSPLHKFTT